MWFCFWKQVGILSQFLSAQVRSLVRGLVLQFRAMPWGTGYIWVCKLGLWESCSQRHSGPTEGRWTETTTVFLVL